MLQRCVACYLGLVLAVACKEPPSALVLAHAAPPEPAATASATHPVDLLPVRAAPPKPVEDAEARAHGEPRCNEQSPQAFLTEAHFDSYFALGSERRRKWSSVLSAAVRYRTEQYGYVKGYGQKSWNSRTPWQQARTVTFFGVAVTIHERIAGALACVETEIRARCAEHAYQPWVLSGMRRHNPYPNGEISNHVYGIAIDVDPVRNPCCGCIGSWRSSARCRNAKSKFERMDMPVCWVEQFERFGFHWLGRDRIEDTMHFEFLGDPGRIAR